MRDVEQQARGTALILSGDRDMYQCAGERCRVLYLKTGARGAEIVDEAEVVKRYGVPAALVPDFIALRGDPSDGIPGARGIGQKTAAALLRQHGSLEAVIAAARPAEPRRAAGASRAGRRSCWTSSRSRRCRRSTSSGRPTARPISPAEQRRHARSA